ncbi:MAG: Sec-independent protein translocase protein TatB [Halieaceae bacterium]|jgi:sec-independent protein translocase protein TatB|nr:Sec-independent protein translocase protein TatB [Halieaceae bacterium]
MFDIGFLELVIVSIVGLLVLGPERLPGAIRTVSLYVNKIRRSLAGIRADIERELKADEIRQDLHNQSVMEELKQAEKALRSGLSDNAGLKLGKDGYPIGSTVEDVTAASVRKNPVTQALKKAIDGPAEAPPELHEEKSPAPATDASSDAPDSNTDDQPADETPSGPPAGTPAERQSRN